MEPASGLKRTTITEFVKRNLKHSALIASDTYISYKPLVQNIDFQPKKYIVLYNSEHLK